MTGVQKHLTFMESVAEMMGTLDGGHGPFCQSDTGT